jgi:hypothetical protein
MSLHDFHHLSRVLNRNLTSCSLLSYKINPPTQCIAIKLWGCKFDLLILSVSMQTPQCLDLELPSKVILHITFTIKSWYRELWLPQIIILSREYTSDTKDWCWPTCCPRPRPRALGPSKLALSWWCNWSTLSAAIDWVNWSMLCWKVVN